MLAVRNLQLSLEAISKPVLFPTKKFSMDFSVYLMVINQLDISLTDPTYSASHGTWTDRPTAVRARGDSHQFRLKDNFGAYGAEGTLSYSLGAFGNLSMKFGCPFSADNYFSTTNVPRSVKVTFVGSNNGNRPSSGFPRRGHPLYIWITVAASASQDINFTSLMADPGGPAIGLPNINSTTTNLNNPVWTPNMRTYDGVGGSLYPLAFVGSVTFIMRVDITSVVGMHITGLNSSGTEIIKGTWYLNSMSITLQMAQSVNGFFSRNQTLRWKATNVHDPKQELTINGPSNPGFSLEFYGLFQRPINSIFPNRGFIQVYRALGLAIGDTSDSQRMASKVSSFCVLNPGSTPIESKNIYDRGSGASHYAVSPYGGSTFRLLEYVDVQLPRHLCNCYDQAAGVQALLAIVGISTNWYFMNRFGFINTTPLVGWGACNNPFDINSGYLVLPQNDPARTSFGNHGFCSFETYILDATSAGHEGTETLNAYLANAVDSTTILYSNPPYRGTEANARTQVGLTSIDAVVPGVRYKPLTELKQHAYIQELQTGGLNIALPATTEKRYVVMDWTFVEDLLMRNGLPYQFTAQYTTLGEEEVERVWHFVQGENMVSILVSVHAEEEIALRKLMTTAVETQASFNPFLVQPLGDGGLRNATGGLIEWKFANCWVRITTTTPEAGIMAIATIIQQQMEQHLQTMIPQPSLVGIPAETIGAVGTEIALTWQVEPGILTEVGAEGNGLAFLYKIENGISYTAIQPSLNTVSVVAADNRTLISNKVTVIVRIE
jgi:hypothetical protein